MRVTTSVKGGIIGFGVLLLVFVVAWVEAGGNARVEQSMVEDVAVLNAELADRPAPPFSLPLLDGSELDLASLRGKVVFLNFWASWCPPCREEMPSMEQLARKYEGRDLVMVAVTEDTDEAALQRFMGQFMPSGKPVMKIARDPKGVLKLAYGTEKLPETYIIDREGRIVARFVNKYDWMRPEVDRFIERLLRR